MTKEHFVFNLLYSTLLTVCVRSHTESSEIAMITPCGVNIVTYDTILNQSEHANLWNYYTIFFSPSHMSCLILKVTNIVPPEGFHVV